MRLTAGCHGWRPFSGEDARRDAANERRCGPGMPRIRISAGTMPAVPLGRGCLDGGPRGETLSPSL